MNIYTYLQEDHAKVSQFFTALLAAKTNLIRKEYQVKIIFELLIHASTEEDSFYKKLKQYDNSESIVNHGLKEHDEIKGSIKDVRKEEVGTPEWRKCVQDLEKLVKHHVKEEEGEMFTAAKKVLSSEEAIELAAEMAALKIKTKGKIEKELNNS